MFTPENIKIANKTSRAGGAVGKNAITPRAVREYVDAKGKQDTDTILDFGAGKTAAHQQAMLADGYMVTAYEFGDNVDKRYHNELALMQKYNIVYASNVLNVQAERAMLDETLNQIQAVLVTGGKFFANYPASPRKSDMDADGIKVSLLVYFSMVERVGGTKLAPLWMCTK